MTVGFTPRKIIYQGNGVCRQWDIPFPFLDKAHIKIYKIDEAGSQQELTADFEIDLDLNAVIYPLPSSDSLPLAVNQKILILRKTPLTQSTEFTAQQSFDPHILEEGYDKATLIMQELAEEIARMPAVSAGDEKTPHFSELLNEMRNLHQSCSKAAQVSQEQASYASESAAAAATFDPELYLPKKGGTVSGPVAVSATATAGNKLGLTVAQNYVSDPLHTSFVEGRSGAEENKILGRMGFIQNAQNQSGFFVQAYDPTNNAQKGTPFSVGYDGEKTYVRAITPPTTSNGTDVVTTRWARSVGTGLPFPSSNFTNLTLGANGSNYTAPADGWIQFTHRTNAAGSFIGLHNNTSGIAHFQSAHSTGQLLRANLPVKKGDSFLIEYSSSAENAAQNTFRFIYAEGAK